MEIVLHTCSIGHSHTTNYTRLCIQAYVHALAFQPKPLNIGMLSGKHGLVEALYDDLL